MGEGGRGEVVGVGVVMICRGEWGGRRAEEGSSSGSSSARLPARLPDLNDWKQQACCEDRIAMFSFKQK
jgi:hypothetical protein